MDNEMVSYKQETVAPAKTFVNRDASQTRLIAGVSVPDGPLITAVIEHAQRLSEPYLFNHAMRSWLFAEAIGHIKGIDYDREVVAIGTILHDIGLTASVSGPNRFEVNGADAALSFIKGKGLSDRRAQLIWDLVALNSTPSLALHKEPEVAVGTLFIKKTKSCCHKISLSPVLAKYKDRWLRNALVKNEGDNDENRSDRRYWTHRIKACQQAS